MSTNIYVPNFSKEVESLKQKRRLSFSLAQGHGKTSDLESEAKYSDTEELLKEIISENQKIFLASFVIVVFDQNIETLKNFTWFIAKLKNSLQFRFFKLFIWLMS